MMSELIVRIAVVKRKKHIKFIKNLMCAKLESRKIEKKIGEPHPYFLAVCVFVGVEFA